MAKRAERNANRRPANRKTARKKPKTSPAGRKPFRRIPQLKLPTRGHIQLGRNVRRLRTRNGLSLTELAAACKLKPGDLERIENGTLDPSLEIMLRLARRLAVPFPKFFWGVKG